MLEWLAKYWAETFFLHDAGRTWMDCKSFVESSKKG